MFSTKIEPLKLSQNGNYKNSHDDLLNVIQTAQAPIFGIDCALCVNEWNLKAQEITGFSKTDVFNMPFLNLIEDEYKNNVESILRKALMGENTANYQQKMVTKNKATIILILNATTRYNMDKKICGVIGIAQDVTELFYLQSVLLRENNDLLKSNMIKMFDSMDGCYAWHYRIYKSPESNEKNRFLLVSNGTTKVVGLTPDEVISHDNIMLETLTESSYNDYLNDVKYRLSDTTSLVTSNYYTLKNGKRILVNIMPLQEENEYIDFIGITFDVPDKQKLDLIIENSSDLIMLDECGLITFTSPSWKLFGFKLSPIGMNIHNFISDDMIEKCHCINGATNENQTYTLIGKMNNISVETSVSIMENQTLTITRNIEDRIKRHEAEKNLAIETTKRMKDNEANSFQRHEVKNGLLSAIGHVESFIKMHEHAKIDNNLLSMEYNNDMYNRYQDLKLDLEYTLENVLFNAMAKDIINNEYVVKQEKCCLNEYHNKIKGDRYKWNLNPCKLPEIEFDGQLYFSVLRNALSNACKYGKQWGDIYINIILNDNNLVLIIENEPGYNHSRLLTIEDPNIIFEKGISLHSKNDCKSSGDGAWIIKTIANLCNGNCNIKFTKNKTIFTFSCPIKICVGEEQIDNFLIPENSMLFFIDDSKIQRKLMEIQIKNMGLSKHDYKIYGESIESTKNFKLDIVNTIKKFPDKYFIIICDENLDYSDSLNYENIFISGSNICDEIRKYLNNSNINGNILFFIRSANDSATDINKYLINNDGFIEKKMDSSNTLLRQIGKIWLSKFGVTNNIFKTKIKLNFDGEEKELKEICIIDITNIINHKPIKVDKKHWCVLWSELHKLKGSLQVINEIVDTSYVIEIIESMRNNNYDTEFDSLWNKLIVELTKIKDLIL